MKKNILPLLPYYLPDQALTKRLREQENKKFFKKIRLITSKNSEKKRISPEKRKLKIILPKINISSINNKKPFNDKKILERYLSFDEKIYLKDCENAKVKVLNTNPKNKLYMQNSYEGNLLKSKDNSLKKDKKRIDVENSNYRDKIIKISNSVSCLGSKNEDF